MLIFRNILLINKYKQMKTKNSIIYLIIAFAVLLFSGCKGDRGLDGLDGQNGQNAEVYYSEWFSPTAWSGASGDWYFNASAPDLTKNIVESGVILAYVALTDDLYAAAVRPLPAYAVGSNWDFLIPDYKSIEFTSTMVAMPLTTGNQFRFIAIPGTIPALKSASLKNKTVQELRNMPYKDVCKLFNIPE